MSPGDLTQYHADLEGLLNCTKCHDLGEGVSEAKCLDCESTYLLDELKVELT